MAVNTVLGPGSQALLDFIEERQSQVGPQTPLARRGQGVRTPRARRPVTGGVSPSSLGDAIDASQIGRANPRGVGAPPLASAAAPVAAQTPMGVGRRPRTQIAAAPTISPENSPSGVPSPSGAAERLAGTLRPGGARSAQPGDLATRARELGVNVVDGVPQLTNADALAASQRAGGTPGGAGMNFAEANEEFAKANAIRQQIIDSQRPARQLITIGDSRFSSIGERNAPLGVRKANADRLATIQSALLGLQGKQISADATVQAAGIGARQRDVANQRTTSAAKEAAKSVAERRDRLNLFDDLRAGLTARVAAAAPGSEERAAAEAEAQTLLPLILGEQGDDLALLLQSLSQ